MAYTICDRFGEPMPLRLIMSTNDGGFKVGEPFTPIWWVCDPCNPSSRRYEIVHRQDYPAQPYPWHQVVTSDDAQHDIDIKIEHYRKVIAAAKALDDARREWERLNGR